MRRFLILTFGLFLAGGASAQDKASILLSDPATGRAVGALGGGQGVEVVVPPNRGITPAGRISKDKGLVTRDTRGDAAKGEAGGRRMICYADPSGLSICK